MNKLNLSKLFWVIVLVLSFTPLFAQNENNEISEVDTAAVKLDTRLNFEKYMFLSGDFGIGILDGDNTKFKLGFNGHFGIGYQFDELVALKANFGYGSLNGRFEEPQITIDKLNYFEANINLLFDAFGIIFGYNPDRKFTVQPHIGVGQIQYRLNALTSNGSVFQKVGYNDVETTSGSGIQGRKVVASMPLGLELDYSINKRWKLYLDFIANYTDSDLVEGVNGDYKNDWFYTINVGTIYRLGLEKGRVVKVINEDGVEEEVVVYDKVPSCNYWYIMADAGGSYLFGDNHFNFSSLKSNYNVGVGYNFGDYYRLYGKIGLGNISGLEKDNAWVITDNNMLHATANFAFDIIGLIARTTEKRLELYPHIGIGQTQFRTTTSVNGEGLKQVGYNNTNKYNTKGTGLDERKVAFTFPLGIELAYNVTDRTDLYADATSYLTQNDLLDCIISGSNNDAYSTFNIGLRYKFNRACLEPEECCITPEEVEQAIQEALEQQKAAEEDNQPACVTPEELKQAIKDAIDEYEASRPKVDEKFGTLSNATIINNNYSDISFPQNQAQKIKTQTNIDAINRASSQMEDGSAINRVIIEGYASPEGDNEFNERLARERAEQAAQIIQNELGEIDAERIEITTKGADWEGLYASLENSDIEGKDAIIEELKNSSDKVETMKEILKSHPQVRQLLPQLRRASIVITTIK